jgi:hypothetical protein
MQGPGPLGERKKQLHLAMNIPGSQQNDQPLPAPLNHCSPSLIPTHPTHPPHPSTPPPLQVRYGAEMVFSSSAANITDDDIDMLIQKGQRATEELNNKLQNFTDNARKVGVGWVGGAGGHACGSDVGGE